MNHGWIEHVGCRWAPRPRYASPSQWDWSSRHDYDALHRIYHEAGVGVLDFFYGSPAYVGRIGPFPKDLILTAQAWRHIAEQWRSDWAAVEVWNEPNNSSNGKVPADQYAPLVAAVSEALHRHADHVLVGGGVLTAAGAPLDYLRTAAGSGLLNLVDFLSYHTYAHASAMESEIRGYRDELTHLGRPHLPLWITESGRPWTRGPARPPMREDQNSALDITMKAIEARACGIARYFAFTYLCFEARNSNYGMMGRQATPLRSFAAYAQAIQALAHSRYLGDLVCKDPSVIRARVFAVDGDQAVVVIYTGQARSSAGVRLGLTPREVRGIDGRLLKVEKDGEVPVPDGLSYVYVNRAQLKNVLNTNTPAAKLYQLAAGLVEPSVHSPIVLQFLPDKHAVTPYFTSGYQLESPDVAASLPVTIRASNLDTQAHAVTLTLARVTAKGKTLPLGEARQLDLKAQGAKAVMWRVDVSGAWAEDPTRPLRLRAQATGAGVGAIQSLLISLQHQATLASLLKRFPKHRRLPLDQLDRWERNAANGAQTSLTSRNGVWRLTAVFKDHHGNWAFPCFRLPDRVSLASVSGLIVRGRASDKAQLHIIFREGKQGNDVINYVTANGMLFPADGRWHAAFVPLDAFHLSINHAPDPNHHLDLDRVRTIAVGLTGVLPRNTFEISDFYLVNDE